MANAEVDDDVFNADLIAYQLEFEMAKLMDKEVAFFVPSNIMANLISIMVHCNDLKTRPERPVQRLQPGTG